MPSIFSALMNASRKLEKPFLRFKIIYTHTSKRKYTEKEKLSVVISWQIDVQLRRAKLIPLVGMFPKLKEA